VKSPLVASILAFCLCALPSAARATYIQNFDALTLGPINGQDGWSGGAGDVITSEQSQSGWGLKVVTSLNCRRDTIFSSYAAAPIQRIEFDFLFTQFGSSGSTVWFDMLGPIDVPSGRRFERMALANDKLFFSGAQLSPSLQTNIWYHASADLNFATSVSDFIIRNPNGTTFYNPNATASIATVGGSLPDALEINAALGPTTYMDNLAISNIPEPATGLLAAATCAAAAALSRRR
jgi:hypothetical protein